MLRALSIATILALASGLAGAFAAESVERRKIILGPLTFGMSLGEIKAATPELVWHVEVESAFTGRVLQIGAHNALAFGGQRASIRAREERYDRDITLNAEFPAASALACEQAGFEWLIAVESAAGALAARDRWGPPFEPLPVTWNAVRRGDKAFDVTPVSGRRARKSAGAEWISFGAASAAHVAARDPSLRYVPYKDVREGRRGAASTGSADDDVVSFSLSAGIEAKEEKLEVRAHAAFEAERGNSCHFNAEFRAWTEMPPRTMLDFGALPLAKEMSIGDKHRLAGAVVLPPGGGDFAFNCEISRQTGATSICHGPEYADHDPEVLNLAKRYAAAMVFDTAALDRDDPQPVLMTVPVRVGREDVKAIDFAARAPLTMAEIAFSRRPSYAELERLYPSAALRTEVGGAVRAICQVQTDGSLICTGMNIAPSEDEADHSAAFAKAAAHAAQFFRAASLL